jgi:hypothetical protein
MELEVKQPSGVWLKALVTDVLPSEAEESSTLMTGMLLPKAPSTGHGEGSGADKLEVSYVNGPAAMQKVGLDKCRRQIEGAKAAQQQQKLAVGQTIEVYLAQAAGASMGWQLAKVKDIKVSIIFQNVRL